MHNCWFSGLDLRIVLINSFFTCFFSSFFNFSKSFLSTQRRMRVEETHHMQFRRFGSGMGIAARLDYCFSTERCPVRFQVTASWTRIMLKPSVRRLLIYSHSLWNDECYLCQFCYWLFTCEENYFWFSWIISWFVLLFFLIYFFPSQMKNKQKFITFSYPIHLGWIYYKFCYELVKKINSNLNKFEIMEIIRWVLFSEFYSWKKSVLLCHQ